MSQIVELSDDLIHDAGAVGQLFQRPVERQIEQWVALGRLIERFLRADQIDLLLSGKKANPLCEMPSVDETIEDECS